MFECDGCGFTASLEEVEAHILEQDIDDVASIKCWGAMEVGSVVWEAYHGSGVHPMELVMNMVVKKYLEHFEEELL